jgi:hypothetical protein
MKLQKTQLSWTIQKTLALSAQTSQVQFIQHQGDISEKAEKTPNTSEDTHNKIALRYLTEMSTDDEKKVFN